jgi:hypothetical protein
VLATTCGVVRVNSAAALEFSEAAEASHYTSMLFCEGQSSCVPVRHTHISTASPDSGTGVQQTRDATLQHGRALYGGTLISRFVTQPSRSWFLTKAYNAANSRVCIRKATSHQTDRRDGMADRMAGKKMRWRRGVKQYRSKICLLHTKYSTLTKTQHRIKIKSDCLVNSSDQTGLITSRVPAMSGACLS